MAQRESSPNKLNTDEKRTSCSLTLAALASDQVSSKTSTAAA